MSRENSASRKLFNEPWLEKLSRTHIAIPLAIFFTYSLALLLWSLYRTSLNTASTFLIFAGGLLFWTWLEYMVHRFVFHHAEGTPFQYTIHGVHHAFPKDKDRLAMPPVISIALATLLLFAFRMLLGESGFAFASGFLCGYASYLCVHYIIHVYPRPRNVFSLWWVNHSIHHYQDGQRCFGVSSPLWDYVFGTQYKKSGRNV